MSKKLNWTPTHQHSLMSLLDGISKPKDMAKRCVELGYTAAALTDHGNVSGIPLFAKEMASVGIKPLLGLESYVCQDDASVKTPENRYLAHLCIIAKNLNGWKDLLRLVGKSNDKENFYYKNRLSLDQMREFTSNGNLLAFSGHPGSDLADVIFIEPKAAYRALSYDEIRDHHIHPDAGQRLLKKIEHYVSVFGRDNFFLEAQGNRYMPATIAILKALRWASLKTGIPLVATADSHYVLKEDAVDHRVALCANLKTTLNQVRRKQEESEDIALGGFFKSNEYHIPSVEELLEFNTREEIEFSNEIAKMVDDYSILSSPKIPNFPLTGGRSQQQYLRDLCEDGWRDLIANNPLLPYPEDDYRQRLDQELALFEGAGLSSYFNIVNDAIMFSKRRGRWCGKARGSAGGSLVAYLSRITEIDPLKYGLMVERFYNEGRNTVDYVSLPDIDMDYPKSEREHVKRHLQEVYGVDNVSGIGTFTTLAGKSIVDEVLAAHEIPYDTRKQITSIFPDKARITEELEDMKERGENPSVINYMLDVYADDLAEWVKRDKDGTLSGDYGQYFEQALRLEGIKKARSKHAAGMIISDEPLAGLCPLRHDEETNGWIADMEYNPHLEAMGLMKLDVLGVAQLDKCEGIRNLLATGHL